MRFLLNEWQVFGQPAPVSRLVRIADHTRIVDNSGDLPVMICEVHGTVVTVYDNPYWSKKEILALLSSRGAL